MGVIWESRWYNWYVIILADVLEPLSEEHIPRRLRERLAEEHEVDAARKKEKTEAHLYTTVNVRTSATYVRL